MLSSSSSISILFGTLALFIFPSILADVVVLTGDNFEKEVGHDRPALIEFYAPRCFHSQKLAPEYEELGALFKKTKSVLIGKVNCKEHKKICRKYKVSGYPTINWFAKGSLEPKKYKGACNSQALTAFVNIEAGTKVKYTRIPPIVAVLNDNNFDKIVLDNTKDVLVEFYAPWCSYCQSLDPIYQKVATVFSMDEDIVIANLNADNYKNLVEKYSVIGLPTLKFFPKNNKTGEDYDGGRDLEDFVSFINEKCGTSRDESGKLTSTAGIIEDLGNLVKEFVSAGDDEKKAIFLRMEKEVGILKGSASRYGKIYLKAAKSCMDKGSNYAKNEISRLERILARSISSEKTDEFTLKKNILSAFA